MFVHKWFVFVKLKNFFFTVKNVFLAKITILHIFYRFGDHTAKKNSSQTSAQLIIAILRQSLFCLLENQLERTKRKI